MKIEKRITKRQRKCFVEWLGIPESECPPDHYRLLDLPTFESSEKAIRDAVRKRRLQIQKLAPENELEDAKAIHHYLVKAGNTLLNDDQKQRYDEGLRSQLAKRTPPTADAKPSRTAKKEHVAASPKSEENELEGEATSALDQSRPREARRFPLPTIALVVGNVCMLAMVAFFLANPYEKNEQTPPKKKLVTLSESISGGTAFDNEQSTDPRDATFAVPSARDTQGPLTLSDDSGKRTTNSQADEQEFDRSIQETEEKSIGEKKRRETVTSDNHGAAKLAQDLSEPFEELQLEFDLPTIPTAQTGVSATTSPGKIKPGAFKALELQLDNSAIDVEDLYEFNIETIVANESEARRWRVVANPVGNSAGSEYQIGFFFIDQAHQLCFGWDMKPPFPNAPQLRNALLVISFKNIQKTIQLRRAAHRERIATRIEKSKTTIPLDIEHPPSIDSLYMKVSAIKNIDYSNDIPEILANTRKHIMGGEQGRVQLSLHFKQNHDDRYQMEVRPHIEKVRGKERSMPVMSWPELAADVNRLQKIIRNSVRDFHGAKANLALQVPLRSNLQNELNNRLVWQRQNPKRASEVQQIIQGLRARISTLNGRIKRNKRTASIMSEKIPKSYESFVNLIALRRIARDLHNKGELEFELMAKTKHGNIRLLVADGESLVQGEHVEIPPLDLTGNWFRFSRNWVYELQGDNNGGAATIRSPYAEPEQRLVHSGSWQRNGQTVSVRSHRWSETFTIYEGVMMKRKNSKVKIYKIFD